MKRVWDELTPETIAAMEKRLLRDEAEVIKRHGGNFYDESRLGAHPPPGRACGSVGEGEGRGGDLGGIFWGLLEVPLEGKSKRCTGVYFIQFYR